MSLLVNAITSIYIVTTFISYLASGKTIHIEEVTFRRDEEDLFKIVLAPQNTPIDGVMAMLGYTRFQIGNGTKKQIVFRRFALVP